VENSEQVLSVVWTILTSKVVAGSTEVPVWSILATFAGIWIGLKVAKHAVGMAGRGLVSVIGGIGKGIGHGVSLPSIPKLPLLAAVMLISGATALGWGIGEEHSQIGKLRELSSTETPANQIQAKIADKLLEDGGNDYRVSAPMITGGVTTGLLGAILLFLWISANGPECFHWRKAV
jgi:hypothetical protein